MLPSTSESRLRLGRRRILWLVAAGVLTCALPTLRNAPALAQQEESPAGVEEKRPKAMTEEAKLWNQWESLEETEADKITSRHLKALAVAIHCYADEHNGQLPPPTVPNPALAPEKRLSGLVLLLPYLGKRPSYIEPTDKAWDQFGITDKMTQEALYNAIDLEKAWDDPANLKVAQTVVPVFLSPQGGPVLDKDGYAVSHFAFVRGHKGKDNGAFPLEGKVGIPDITDGTSNTLGLGQIHSHFGPWIAAGPSTSRHVYHPSSDSEAPTFGSPHVGGCYFANCDAYTYFLDMAKTDPKTLRYVTERADGHPVDFGAVARYQTAAEWKASRDHPE